MAASNVRSVPLVDFDAVIAESELSPLMQQIAQPRTCRDDDEDQYHLEHEADYLQEQRIAYQTLHWLRRPSIAMIGLCIFLLTLGTSSAEASRQVIQYKLACNSVMKFSGSKVCDSIEAQVLVLTLQQALQVTLGAATVIALAKVPSLSDKFGRRRYVIFLISFMFFGTCWRYLAVSCFPTIQFALIIIGGVITNAFGGIITMLALCNCYATDISEPSQRVNYLGIVMAFFYVGLSTGPMVGNFLLSHFSSKRFSNESQMMCGFNHTAPEFLPLRFELFILALLIVFAVIVLPESRSINALRISRSASRSLQYSQKPIKEEAVSPKIFSIMNVFKPLRIIFYPKEYVNPSRHDSIIPHRFAVASLIILDCTLIGFALSLGEMFVLFGIYRHKMTAQDLGLLMIFGCSAKAIALTVVNPILYKNFFVNGLGLKPHKHRFDLVDYGMVSIGFLGETVGLFLVANARTKELYFSSFAIAALGSFISPILNSSILKFFPESKIGEVFGAMALSRNVFITTFPLITLSLYKYALREWQRPEIVIYMASVVFFLMFLVATVVIFTLEKEDQHRKHRDFIADDVRDVLTS